MAHHKGDDSDWHKPHVKCPSDAPCTTLVGRLLAGGRDAGLFFHAWVKRPLGVGAISPSGSKLAALMTSEIAASSAPVLELGPGTGVFTRALLDHGLDEKDLTLVELNPDFADLLTTRYPTIRVLRASAENLDFAGEPFGAVVSGLPLLSMPPRTVMAIIKHSFEHLRPGAAFYQFTYGPRCPVPQPMLDRLGLKAVRLGRVIHNIPPACVYRITRRDQI